MAAVPLIPPFTLETATAEGAHGRGWLEQPRPENVSLAYTEDSRWRNRAEFLSGRAEIVEFLTRKWAARTRLPADQGVVGLRRQPHRRALRL